jgi:putative transposase
LCDAEEVIMAADVDQAHVLHALREIGDPLQPASAILVASAPLHPVPEPITGSANIIDLNEPRRDRLGGILYEFEHAA